MRIVARQHCGYSEIQNGVSETAADSEGNRGADPANRGCGLDCFVMSYVAVKPQLKEPYALIGRVRTCGGAAE